MENINREEESVKAKHKLKHILEILRGEEVERKHLNVQMMYNLNELDSLKSSIEECGLQNQYFKDTFIGN